MNNKQRLQTMSKLEIARALAHKSTHEIVQWLREPSDAVTRQKPKQKQELPQQPKTTIEIVAKLTVMD